MENQSLLLLALQVVGGAFCTVLWFNYRDLKTKSEAAQEDLSRYKIHIAENYVTQNELTKAIDALSESIKAVFSKLDRIEDKIDLKADKVR